MTESEALNVLKCTIKEEVEDAYELLIFDFKSKFLQIVPPIKLMIALVKKIERINTAYYVFNTESNLKIDMNPILNSEIKLNLFLNQYQLNVSLAKLQLSSTVEGKTLIVFINLLIEIQKKLYLKLSSYIELKSDDLNKFEIKLSESIDVYKIQTELKELQLEENKISEYIRSQISELNIEDLSMITKSVLNSAKQIDFNGIRREI